MTLSIKERVEALVNPSYRKLTLFACSCMHEIWDLLDEPGRKLIEMAEGYVEGLVERKRIVNRSWDLWRVYTDSVNIAVCYTVRTAAYPDLNNTIKVAHYAAFTDTRLIAKQHQLFDDIFGS